MVRDRVQIPTRFVTPHGGYEAISHRQMRGIRKGQNTTGLARGFVTPHGGMKHVHNAK